jgi:hypothetical protein
MTRSPPRPPSKAELCEMTAAQLSAYIGELQREPEWGQGFRYKAVSKDLEVAVKVREIRRVREKAGEV